MTKLLGAFIQGQLDQGRIPDGMVRAGIRGVLTERLKAERRFSQAERKAKIFQFVDNMKLSPVSVAAPESAAQPYDLPAEFYRAVYGKRLQTFCALWNAGVTDLGRAEEDMLGETAVRAGLQDGQQVLDLSGGWGALSLALAERFPASAFTALMDTTAHKEHVDAEASARGLKNLTTVAVPVGDFETEERFDRVLAVELFERVRNWKEMLRRIQTWMADGARAYAQTAAHAHFATVPTEAERNDPLTHYFFSGRLMPSADLFTYFQEDLLIEKQWRLGGTHYRNTYEAWLIRLDAQRQALWPMFERTYGRANARKWWNYWRIHFMSQAEMFGLLAGSEWIVGQTLFCKK